MMRVEESLGTVGTRRLIGLNETEVVPQDEIGSPHLDPGQALSRGEWKRRNKPRRRREKTNSV